VGEGRDRPLTAAIRSYIPGMATSDERQLHRAIKERAFAPAYYLHGEDEFLKDAAVRQLVAAAVDPATRDFNLEVRRGADLNAETVESLLDTPPMMADRRAVVVRDVGALRKDARQALDRYLARPAPDVVVVLVSPAGAKPDKGLAERAAAVEFQPLTGDRVPKWIVHHAQTAHGATITTEAAALLQSAVGSDLPQLAAELDKLASFVDAGAGGELRPIDEEAVAAVVGVRRGETLGDLLDAVAAQDARRALALVDHVLAQPKTSLVQVVMALSTQMLALACGRAMRAQGTPASRMEGEFFNLLREGGGFPGRPWGEATRAWARHLDRWSAAALDEALDLLLDADVAAKESRLSSDEQLLASLVLSLCAAGAERRAA
jgi:DNA polymerase III subunit delta